MVSGLRRGTITGLGRGPIGWFGRCAIAWPRRSVTRGGHVLERVHVMDGLHEGVHPVVERLENWYMYRVRL